MIRFNTSIPFCEKKTQNNLMSAELNQLKQTWSLFSKWVHVSSNTRLGLWLNQYLWSICLIILIFHHKMFLYHMDCFTIHLTSPVRLTSLLQVEQTWDEWIWSLQVLCFTSAKNSYITWIWSGQLVWILISQSGKHW